MSAERNGARFCLALVVCAVLLWGCSSSQGAFRTWQRSLEAYVTDHGNGDPNVLRALAEDPTKPDFGLIGAQNAGVLYFFPVRTDVSAVLLGHRRLDDRFWFIYLAGAVKYRGTFTDFPIQNAELLDIRPVLFSADGGGYEWRLGMRDCEALHLYCRPQVEAWRLSDPGRESESEAPTTFPTPADDWQLEIDGETVRVTDAHSGATWSLIVTTNE